MVVTPSVVLLDPALVLVAPPLVVVEVRPSSSPQETSVSASTETMIARIRMSASLLDDVPVGSELDQGHACPIAI
jgi:hypothetical protein